jgi:CRP-like cAMP-binding protein
VVLDADLAYASSTYRAIEAQALDLAGRAPLTPAVLRDATGTSRKYVLAILADLDRRGLLRRTEAGHLPGPRSARVSGASATVTPGGR